MLDHIIFTRTVEAADLRDLAVNAFINNDDSNLTRHLLAAWNLLWESETDDEIPGFTGSDEDCRKRYAFFMKVYNAHLGHKSNEGMEPEWPEGFLPRWFVQQIARIEGQKDKQGMAMCRELYEEKARDEAAKHS